MTSGIDFSVYSTCLFIDSMVALEGKPLPQQPWNEIDPLGPILLLVVPQVNTEIDKRKRDGRLAKRAREFNRLIGPAAESASPVCICEGPPAVDVAIAACGPINWDALDDLDPDDQDARVVAQILHARGVPAEKRLLFSQDINPISMAARHDLKTRKMPETWLLEPEPSPNEKEMMRLKSRVRELEAKEPDVKIELTFDIELPIRLYRVDALSNDEQSKFIRHILRENPKISQNPLEMIGRDYSYDERHQKYRNKLVPRHAAGVHRKLEAMYSQVPFTLTVRNAGHVQAENLVVALRSASGGLQRRFRLYPPYGPTAPEPRNSLFGPIIRNNYFSEMKQPAGRHEMDFAVGLDGGDTVEVHCADFRHGREWIFSGIARIDPHVASPFKIEVSVTASNQRGERSKSFELEFETRDVETNDLLDLEGSGLLAELPMKEQLDEASDRKNMERFEFVQDDDADDED